MDEKCKDKIIRKSNTLINARFKLGVNEQKILYKVISLINYNDKDFKNYEIKVIDLIKFLNAKNKNVHNEIKKYIKNLVKEMLVIIEKDKEIYTHWFSLAEYHNNNELVVFNFHPRIKPHLLDLQTLYTSFGINNIRKFKSKYSPRLYEMFKQFEDTGYKIITIKKLRYILSLENKYKNYNDFKKIAILVPQQEINQTDIKVDFKEIKEGRSITKFEFFITGTSSKKNKKGKTKESKDNEKSTPEQVFDQTDVKQVLKDEDVDKVINMFETNYNLKLNYDLTKKLVEIKGLECVNECIGEIKNYVTTINQQKFYDFTMKYGTEKEYIKMKTYNNNNFKPIQATNYEQRQYDDDFFNSLYDNDTFSKTSGE